MAARIPARLGARDGRKFAFTLSAAFLAVGGLAWWRAHGTASTVLGAIGGLWALAGLVLPSRLGPIYRAWMGLALAISKVTTPIFMALVYFAVVTPVGLVMRLGGRNPLRREPENGSFWIDRRAQQDRRGTMKNQF